MSIFTSLSTPGKSHTEEARKLERDQPPTPNQRQKEDQLKSSYIHLPTFWSLLYIYIHIYLYPYPHLSISISIHVSISISTYVSISISIYIHIHIYICIYIYIYLESTVSFPASWQRLEASSRRLASQRPLGRSRSALGRVRVWGVGGLGLCHGIRRVCVCV